MRVLHGCSYFQQNPLFFGSAYHLTTQSFHFKKWSCNQKKEMIGGVSANIGLCRKGAAELADIGYNVAVFPLSSVYTTARGIWHVLQTLYETGSTSGCLDKMIIFD